MAKRRASVKVTKNLIIAIVAIILIIAIAFCVLYFGFPAKWDYLMSLITPEGDNTPPLQRGDGELAVHFIDIGQGDCILIQFPDGKDMLIDCGTDKGGDWAEVKAYLEEQVPDDQLDYLMLTHADEDHVSYLPDVLELFDVDNVYMPYALAEPTGTSATAQRLRDEIAALPEEKTAVFKDEDTIGTNIYAEFFIAALSEPEANIIFNMDKNESENAIVIADESNTYRLAFYCPTEQYYEENNIDKNAYSKNAVSPVGILEYNDVRFVFTGDSNEENEPIIAERIGNIDCDYLKVAHHGSDTSSLDEFLDAVDCEYAIISCGGKHGHPTQEALTRFKARGMEVYRTDNNGNIVVVVGAEEQPKLITEKDVPQDTNFIPGDAEQTALPSVFVLRRFIAS